MTSTNGAQRTPMSLHPLERAAADAIDRWTKLTSRPDDTNLAPVVELMRLLPVIAHRAVQPGPAYDGYRTGGEHHLTELGGDDVRLTSVEGAAQARLANGNRRAHDPAAEHGHRTVTRVVNAVVELEGALDAARAFARLTAEEDELVDAPVCDPCNEILTVPRPAARYSDVGGRLPRPRRLCAEHYQFVVDHGHEPTQEQTVQHDRTGRWRIRTTG